jgi:hypothetical protein
MMRIATIAIAAALACAPAPLAAQVGPRLGGQVSFAEQENAGLGLRLEQTLTPARPGAVRLMFGFDYFFPDSPFTYWELNTDLAWGFGVPGWRVGMYAGGGLNMVHNAVDGVPGSGSSDVGVNLLFGIRIPTGSQFTPFVELRPELGGGNRLVLTTGILF